MGGNNTCDAVVMLVNTVIGSLLTPQSVEDITSPTSLKNGDTFDFIIVGGGSAGCVLANRLSELECYSVLLLEAGGEPTPMTTIPGLFPLNQGSRTDWGYRTEPEPQYNGGRPVLWPRGKVLGGSSSINTMIYNRGNKKDYDKWAELGNKGWSYEEVLPYFKKSENNLDPEFASDTIHHSTGGYQDVQRFPHIDPNALVILQAWKEIGFPEIDINARNRKGVMRVQGILRNGTRRSTYASFVEPIRKKRKNLKVVTNARVSKILFDKDNTAIGVEFFWEFSTTIFKKIYAKKEVIISAGAINSPQILMLSGIGPKEHLESFGIQVINDLPGVGQNLQDHTGAQTVTYLMPRGKEVIPRCYEEVERDKAKYFSSPADSPFGAIGPSQVTAYAHTGLSDSSADFPDIQFLETQVLSPCCDLEIVQPFCYYNGTSIIPYIMRPKSRGCVTLRSAYAGDLVRIRPQALTEPIDIKILVAGSELALRLADTSIFQKAGFKLDKTPVPGCECHTYGTKEYFTCAVKKRSVTIYHPVGTCKMGAYYDPLAVVDQELRVYGTKHLRVIDGSIMPNIVSSNTNAPTIMIAEKGADYIKRSLKK